MSYFNSNSLTNLYNEIKIYPRLSSIEEQEYLKKIRKGDFLARDYFIKCNLRLAFAFARRNYHNEEEREDAFSAACEALIKATDNYDEGIGVSFGTYAYSAMLKNVGRAILEEKNSFHVPYNKRILLINLLNYISDFQSINNREPREEEICIALNINSNLYQELIDIKDNYTNLYSLNEFITNAEKQNENLEKVILNPDELEKEVLDNIFINDMKSIISGLDKRAQYIIIKRLELDNDKKYSLYQLGQELNLTHEGVRLIEQKALKTLKKELIKKGYYI